MLSFQLSERCSRNSLAACGFFLASGVGCWVHDAISAYRTTEDTNPKVFQSTHR